MDLDSSESSDSDQSPGEEEKILLDDDGTP